MKVSINLMTSNSSFSSQTSSTLHLTNNSPQISSTLHKFIMFLFVKFTSLVFFFHIPSLPTKINSIYLKTQLILYLKNNRLNNYIKKNCKKNCYSRLIEEILLLGAFYSLISLIFLWYHINFYIAITQLTL